MHHPATLQKRPNCEGLLLVRLRHRQNSATTALGVFSVQRVMLKKYFRQRVQNPLMFNLKCSLIAASPARAATPAPRHSTCVIAAHQPQSLANHLKIRAAVACAVARRPSPAPVIRAVTQQHVALGHQHLGRGNRRSSSPESPQLLCTHRGCSQYHARGHLGHVMGVVRIYCRCRRAQAGWS